MSVSLSSHQSRFRVSPQNRSRVKKEAEVGSNRGRTFQQLKLSEVRAKLLKRSDIGIRCQSCNKTSNRKRFINFKELKAISLKRELLNIILNNT